MKKGAVVFWVVVVVLAGVLVGMALGIFPAVGRKPSIKAVGGVLVAAFVLRWLRLFLQRHSRRKK